MIGGFLGAGKTTTLAKLAKHYISQGQRVCLVTNDQAFDLVDTLALRVQGFDVGEVAGACFCCKFADLVDTINHLANERLPDVVITEPVGSCTDLVATVIEPLRRLHGDRFVIAPLAVLCKPSHGLKILGPDKQRSGFSPQAEYIFLKQIEEAHVVIVNKIDRLTDPQRRDLMDVLRGRFPKKELLAMSAKTGEGLLELAELLSQTHDGDTQFMDVDYDTYAAGEAELGWLNATFDIVGIAAPGVSLDEAVLTLMESLRRELASMQLEPAHLKTLVQDAKGRAAMANLVSSTSGVDLSMSSPVTSQAFEFTVNARAAGAPDELLTATEIAIHAFCQRYQCQHTQRRTQHFRPGRPEPTHRVTCR